jgi:hypothetical protein
MIYSSNLIYKIINASLLALYKNRTYEIILYFVERKFDNFNPLDCDIVRNVLPIGNFFQYFSLTETFKF